MNIVFLGPPGSGKGTLAARFAREYSFTQIAPGDLFRKEVKKGTELGKKVKALIDAGILVSYEITNAIVQKNLGRKNIFDGYPRTLEQANALDTFVKIDVAIFFDVTEAEVIERLSGRRTCTKCQAIYHVKNIPSKKKDICDKCGAKLEQRKDDMPEIIKKRFRVYHEQTLPLISFYEKRGLLKEVDASGLPDVVQERVKKLVGL